MPKKDIRYKITLLRHAESVGNAEGYFQGQGDFPLTERGCEQAHALAARWLNEKRKFDYAICSPLSRTRETAEILAEKLELNLEFDSIWMERHNGVVTGLKHAEGRKRFPQPDFRNPYANFAENGEGDWKLFLRAGEALNKLLSGKPGHYLVISHGGLLNMVMKTIVGVAPHANYQGPQFRFGNTAFAKLTYFPDSHRWYIESLNDRNHWRENEQ